MKAKLALALLASLSGLHAQTDVRRDHLDLLLKLLVPSRPAPTGRVSAFENTWEEYLKRTGELPPDFDAMPSLAHLPDPLLLRKGGRTIPVTSKELWEEQKKWIRQQTEQWVFGSMPPAPDNLRARVVSTKREGTATVRDVVLEFGPQHKAILRVQLILPDGPGPFPVFLTNHARNRPWLYTALNRGYAVCVYFATDPKYGYEDDSDAYLEIYPEYDFSCLARWAWSASRAVDYLYTLPEIDKAKIGLTGHSRNGKQTLVAAAFDERITAAVLSSGLTGEALPWRYTSNPWMVESVQLLAGAQPHWFHPRLRFFSGREHKLPVDQNMLMASVAPRGLMIYSGYAESAANPVALEQAYRSALKAYRFLDKEQNLWLRLREGEHGTTAGDIENFMDFFDSVFGRKTRPKSETWIHGYDFDAWRRKTGEKLDPASFPTRSPGDFVAASPSQWESRKAELRANLERMLGEEPPRLPAPLATALPSGGAAPNEGWLAGLLNRPRGDAFWRDMLAGHGMGHAPVSFGDGLQGALFYPANADGSPKGDKWPVAIWLHPYAYATGWSARAPWNPKVPDYSLEKRPSFTSLVNRGFAVFTFDQIGCGTRVHDARDFYDRYPKWSLLGKMIADARDAVSAMAALERVDASRVYLLGYALGARVALWTAAFDGRVKAVASVCGFDPLRQYTPEKGVEGLEHYSHLHGLLPKLGFFVGHERRVPFDYGEILALAAPRPALVVAPQLDRYAPVDDVRREIAGPQKIYRLLGAGEALTLDTPLDFNRFPPATQERVFDWLAKVALGLGP
jgi:dienelactone hydrolase